MDPFLGEIRIFAGNFAPKDWMFCDGAILPISRYTALFSLLGSNYGGNGTTNFALPNLVATFPMSSGTGPGLSQRVVGETGGEVAVLLDSTTIASHSHAPNAVSGSGNAAGPGGAVWAQSSSRDKQFSAPPAVIPMATNLIDAAGGGLPHPNVPPFIAINYIIALAGVFPQRP